MFWNIFTFELRYRFARPATYLYFGLIFLVAFLLFASGNTPASEKVYHNAPVLIAELQLLISLFMIMLAAAIMGVPLYRDIDHKTGNFIFSFPISKSAYFMGRFWGSFVTLLFISFATILGIYLGSYFGGITGWTEAERYGPHALLNYLHPWFTMVLPNLWLASAIFFALIIFTKNIRSIYSGGIILFIGYLLANFLSRDIENKELVQLLDPFALNSFNLQVRYLTPFEQNNYLLSVDGYLGMNRILWSLVGLLFFVAAYFKFDFKSFFQPKVKKTKNVEDAATAPNVAWASVVPNFSGAYQWKSLKTLAKIEVRNVLKDVYFNAILLGGIIFLTIDFWIGNTFLSVGDRPATSLLMEFKGWNYSIFVFIIIVFFTGEALHRGKQTGYAQISDTFPVKNGVLIGSKFLAMALVALILATIPVFIGLAVQTLKGYHLYKLDIYLIDSYLIAFPDYLQMVMLVFAIHLLVNNKFGGHAASIGFWLVLLVVRNFVGYDYNLFMYSYEPEFRWSEMNGLEHFSTPLFWFNIYWTAMGAFLILFCSLFFSRGTESSFQSRWKTFGSRFRSPVTYTAFAFLLISLAAAGVIYQNTAYTNVYLTENENDLRLVAYEKQLKKYEHQPQPKYVDIKLHADIFPEERDAYFRSEIKLVNKTAEVIDSLHLMSPELTTFELIYEGDTLPYRAPLVYDPPKYQLFGKAPGKKWYKIYPLPTSMMPGDTLGLTISSSIVNSGFPNSGLGGEIVYNGTFLAMGIPAIGYTKGMELSSDEKRRKYDLPIEEYELPPHDDPKGRSTLRFVDDADFIDFEAVISTSKDQIAVAPGYIQKEWAEGDRRFFHYVQDTPIQCFFNVVSARYEVFREKVQLASGNDVSIEIFYHPEHEYNLDRFVSSFQDGLVYFSEVYGDFQFRQMRLLEFPRYRMFAQSFPNTVPFSEGFGWLADFSDPNSFDYAYFVGAHELAHQWWGHQVPPNHTRGANLVSEALAEYTALVLAERRYGKDNMHRFLKDELDQYLRGRARENKKENTFINCNRAYQWYYKGALVLYGLRDLIGDSAIDSAIRNFRDEFALKTEPPFAGSNDLYRHLQAYTPDSLMYYLEDTWVKLTLYENKIEEAEATPLEDGKYRVKLTLASQKVYADSAGQETPAAYTADYVDVGIFAAEDTDENGRRRTNPLYLQKHKLSPGQHELEIIVDGLPVKAGIDPYNKLIDRIPDDNVTSVDVSEKT